MSFKVILSRDNILLTTFAETHLEKSSLDITLSFVTQQNLKWILEMFVNRVLYIASFSLGNKKKSAGQNQKSRVSDTKR